MIRWATILVFLTAGPVAALDFVLPSTARQTVERNTAPDIYRAPVGVFENGNVPMITIEGKVNRSAWRLESPGLTPVQVIRPLRGQLASAGYDIKLDCDAAACGGFDFRFAIETLPGPNMYVNIRAFHIVTGTRDSGGQVADIVSVLASTSANSAYVQIIQAGAADAGTVITQTQGEVSNTTAALPAGNLGQQLERSGHAVLSDLDFDSGSTDLGAGTFDTLAQLAAFLESDPEARIALVGHTDSVGGLQPNITISRARARSVRQRLITQYGIAPDRLDAEGMGYLSPLATNLTPAGRDRNRRVEVVLLERSER